jgi:hypothetical protein
MKPYHIIIALLLLAALAISCGMMAAEREHDRQMQTAAAVAQEAALSTEFYAYDIKRAIMHLEDGDTAGLQRYCVNNGLDYEALVARVKGDG